MKYPKKLIQGKLIRRYKRFLADIELENGEEITAHCPNTGSMKNCNQPDSRVWVWDSESKTRKLPITWELVEMTDEKNQTWLACINTSRPNQLVKEAIEQKLIPELAEYSEIKTEKKYGAENSRIDIWLKQAEQEVYVEVKNVTLLEDEGVGYFPDAVSARGTKHLRELMEMVKQGHRGVLVFCVSHTGIQKVKPAEHIDPKYSDTLKEAIANGVEVYAWQADIDMEEIKLARQLPVEC